jgi:hypothetical protein
MPQELYDSMIFPYVIYDASILYDVHYVIYDASILYDVHYVIYDALLLYGI